MLLKFYNNLQLLLVADYEQTNNHQMTYHDASMRPYISQGSVNRVYSKKKIVLKEISYLVSNWILTSCKPHNRSLLMTEFDLSNAGQVVTHHRTSGDPT